MKKIYIVLTHTGTTLSKIIKKYTKDEFSHVSISLDEKLSNMYSFGRLHPYNPFWAGFVQEFKNKGTFGRFKETKTKIYSLEITENQYEIIKRSIENIQENRNKYKFNIIGLLAIGFHKRIKKEQSFYCAEFVKYVIEKAKLNINLPEMIRPEDFKNIKELKLIYNGLLRNYNIT